MTVSGLRFRVIDEDVDRILSEDLPWETFRNSTVLVTGAGGMIPSYVVYTMLGLNDSQSMNIKVIAMVRNPAKALRTFGKLVDRDDFFLIENDVTRPMKIEGPIDYLFHGASPARPSQHSSAPVETIRANLVGTFNLLDLAVEKASRGFVLMSSSEVYGSTTPLNLPADKISDSYEGKKISETDYGYLDTLNPRACYSEGKRAAETICACYMKQFGITCTIPRFAHIYGPGMAIDDGRVQADFAGNIARGENIVMKSDGSSQRAYTYVSDAVTGMFYALLKGSEMAYNIADSSNVISIRQLAEAFIASRPDKNLSLVIDIDKSAAGKFNPALYIGLDNSKIKELGWTPKVPVTEGTSRMVSYLEASDL